MQNQLHSWATMHMVCPIPTTQHLHCDRASPNSGNGNMAAYLHFLEEEVSIELEPVMFAEFLEANHEDMIMKLHPVAFAGNADVLADSIRAQHGSQLPNTTLPADKAALALVLQPQKHSHADCSSDRTPEKQRQRPRQESTASLMETPPPRTLVKFPSQRPSRQSGIARALSFWNAQMADTVA